MTAFVRLPELSCLEYSVQMAKSRLSDVLKKKGISKLAFARMRGVVPRTVFRETQKTYDPKLSKLTSWAKALGCKVRDLIKE